MLGPKIQIVSRKFINPSNPTPKHLQSFKLSVFDRLAPASHIKIVLYFSNNEEHKAENNYQRQLSELEESLAHTLSKFYPLTGRLVKDQEQLFIDCSDQGAEYLETKVDKELAEFLHQGVKDGSLDQLLPQEVGAADSATSPLLTIQTNLFDCGGLALGVCVSHKVADTSTVVSFINEWAKSNQGEINNKVLCPCFSVPSSFPVKNYIVKNVPEFPIDMGMKIVARRFMFDGSKIAELKDIFKKNATTHHEIQPTRVTLVTAVIWKALINVAQAKHGQLRPSLLSPAMNLRGRTEVVPISQNAFGNSWIPIIARFTPHGDRLEWFDLVPPLSSAVRNTAEVIRKANSEEISLIEAGAFMEVHEEILRNDGVDVFICSSWSRFPAYEADFGWGRPSWVSCSSEDFEMFTLLDSKCGEGIEAWVCFNEEDMFEFEQNTDICKFTSLC